MWSMVFEFWLCGFCKDSTSIVEFLSSLRGPLLKTRTLHVPGRRPSFGPSVCTRYMSMHNAHAHAYVGAGEVCMYISG